MHRGCERRALPSANPDFCTTAAASVLIDKHIHAGKQVAPFFSTAEKDGALVQKSEFARRIPRGSRTGIAIGAAS